MSVRRCARLGMTATVAVLALIPIVGCSISSSGVVVGTVTEAPGVPCAECAIGLTPLTPGLTVIEMARYTDSEGTFRVERLQPGEYRVSVFHDGPSAEAHAVVEPGRTTVTDLALP